MASVEKYARPQDVKQVGEDSSQLEQIQTELRELLLCTQKSSSVLVSITGRLFGMTEENEVNEKVDMAKAPIPLIDGLHRTIDQLKAVQTDIDRSIGRLSKL